MAIRELTKSIVSFSWAMTLFPVQQTLNILKPSEAAESFNNVTKATKEEFDNVLEATFKAGDNLQRGVLDLTFGVFALRAFNPTNWVKTTADVVRRAAKATSDVAQQTVKTTSGMAEQTVKATSDAAQQTIESLGRATPGAGKSSKS